MAEHFEDERFLSTPTLSPIQHHVPHWLAVSDTHIAFDQSVNGQDRVQIIAWLNEWDAVNKHETAPEKRYRIYTLIRERPRLVCAPDAAFLLALERFGYDVTDEQKAVIAFQRRFRPDLIDGVIDGECRAKLLSLLLPRPQ